jgi:hypothetical protein
LLVDAGKGLLFWDRIFILGPNRSGIPEFGLPRHVGSGPDHGQTGILRVAKPRVSRASRAVGNHGSERNRRDSPAKPQQSHRVKTATEHSSLAGARWPLRHWILSGLIVFQLLAIFAGPFQFFTRSSRGTSPLSDLIRWPVEPYIEFAFLDHGYSFFAPQPGPSHLIDCSFVDQEGKLSSVRYPDRRAQWPRLLYHRHFMLTENLQQLWVEPVDPLLLEARQANPEEADVLTGWTEARRLYETIRDSMATHVANKFGADEVQIDRVEHRLPTDEEVLRKRMRLNAPEFYITLPDAVPGPTQTSPVPMLPPQVDAVPADVNSGVPSNIENITPDSGAAP